MRDPLTGEERPISNNLKDLRRARRCATTFPTPTGPGAATSATTSTRATTASPKSAGRWEGPIWGSLFVERKNVHGLTVRFSASNLTDAMSMWDRTVYVDRRTGPVDFIEDRDRRIGPIFSFSVSGKF